MKWRLPLEKVLYRIQSFLQKKIQNFTTYTQKAVISASKFNCDRFGVTNRSERKSAARSDGIGRSNFLCGEFRQS